MRRNPVTLKPANGVRFWLVVSTSVIEDAFYEAQHRRALATVSPLLNEICENHNRSTSAIRADFDPACCDCEFSRLRNVQTVADSESATDSRADFLAWPLHCAPRKL
jgi:hypothetical protein